MQQIITWGGIGLIVGIIMGLTGAGGGMSSIPIFTALGYSLRSSSIYSLFAIFFASTINCIAQRKQLEAKISLTIAAVGFVGAQIFARFKAMVPDLMITLTFVAVCCYSLYKVWYKKNIQHTQAKYPWLKIIFVGLAASALVTFTGLGGGLILMPFLMGPLGLSMKHAVPTSLMAISLNASSSLFAQRDMAEVTAIHWQVLVSLALGTFIGTQVIRLFIKKLTPATMLKVRKIVFSALILFALISVTYRELS